MLSRLIQRGDKVGDCTEYHKGRKKKFRNAIN